MELTGNIFRVINMLLIIGTLPLLINRMFYAANTRSHFMYYIIAMFLFEYTLFWRMAHKIGTEYVPGLIVITVALILLYIGGIKGWLKTRKESKELDDDDVVA